MSGKGWTKNYFLSLAAILAIHLLSLAIYWEPLETKWVEVPTEVRIKLHHPTKNSQIVQSEDSDNQRTAVDEAYLSDKTRVFDRQTISRNNQSFKKAAQGNALVTQKKKSSKNKKEIKDIKLSDVGLAHEYAQSFKPVEDHSSETIEGMENGAVNERGLSASSDYLEEMTLGDFTHLNTTEFKHYGFYHRIRQKLEQFWGRSIQEKAQSLYKSGRHIANLNHITAMTVTLNEKGEILSAKIKTSSGIKELDEAAVESFNQAGPFPNPPKDLLENGRAVIEWGFVVKT